MSYDEVGISEALDLALTLPRGSLYVSKKSPEHSWSEAREISADIRDWMAELTFAMHGVANPPHIIRPADVVANASAKERARKAKAKLEGITWINSEGG